MTHISIYNSQNSSRTSISKLTQPNSVEETLLVRFEFVSLFYSGVDTYFVHFSQTRSQIVNALQDTNSLDNK